MKDPGLDNRHRDKNGEISRKHGNTLVRTLRKVYGADFARSFPETSKLSDVLQTLDEPSLSKLIRDHKHDQAAFLNLLGSGLEHVHIPVRRHGR